MKYVQLSFRERFNFVLKENGLQYVDDFSIGFFTLAAERQRFLSESDNCLSALLRIKKSSSLSIACSKRPKQNENTVRAACLFFGSTIVGLKFERCNVRFVPREKVLPVALVPEVSSVGAYRSPDGLPAMMAFRVGRRCLLNSSLYVPDSVLTGSLPMFAFI